MWRLPRQSPAQDPRVESKKSSQSISSEPSIVGDIAG
jgi:hypothetical protein